VTLGVVGACGNENWLRTGRIRVQSLGWANL